MRYQVKTTKKTEPKKEYKGKILQLMSIKKLTDNIYILYISIFELEGNNIMSLHQGL
jgi:hypothetical protein